MKKIQTKAKYIFAAVATVAMLVTSCGKKSAEVTDDAEISEIESIVAENVKGSGQQAAMSVDSLALMADDLTPQEAAQVLATYMHIAAEAKESGNSKLRLETMRKFVDVYDIVTSVNGGEMRAMFDRLYRHSGTINIQQTASDFRAELSDYADGSATDDGSPADIKPDTTAARIDTISSPAAASVEEPQEFVVD